MNVPSIEPIFSQKRVNQMGLSKSLATLGFGTWSELESAGNVSKKHIMYPNTYKCIHNTHQCIQDTTKYIQNTH